MQFGFVVTVALEVECIGNGWTLRTQKQINFYLFGLRDGIQFPTFFISLLLPFLFLDTEMLNPCSVYYSLTAMYVTTLPIL